MKIKIVLIAITVALLISACEPNWHYPDLGSSYGFDMSSRNYIYLINTNNNIVLIDDIVTRFDVNSTFIIVEQKPATELSKLMPYSISSNYDKEKKYMDTVSILFHYWIINKTLGLTRDTNTHTYKNIFGPFDYAGFLEARKDFGVPDSLVLKEVKLIHNKKKD